MNVTIKCLKLLCTKPNYGCNLNSIFRCGFPVHYYFKKNTNIVRSYSQISQVAVEVTKSPAFKKTKRHPRKKSIQQTIEKTGFWNVIAVATAEQYNLDNMYKSLIKSDDYQPSKLFQQIYEAGTDFEFLHIVSKIPKDKENKEIFIFSEGSLVLWNISDLELPIILNSIKNFEINPYDQAIVKEEIEIMPYTYSINSRKSLLQNGNICLTQEENKSALDKYTFSNGMILSVKLGIWEGLLDKYIESMAPLTIDLKSGNPIKITRKQLLRKTGELYALKHSINLSSDLLDVPDFYWDREELEELYLQTCRYFNIFRRTKVINDKINDCIELVDLLSSRLSDKHHIRLEWMIILLIMVEVGFEILHFTQFLFAK